MPGFKLQPSEVDGLVAFIRAGFDVSGTAVKVGHVGRGQAIFEGKGGCAACHRVNGKGPRVAPDLSDIGAIRTPSALQRSLLDPTSAMLPINRPVRAVTRDGRTIRGRRLNEDTYTVQLIDEQERLVSLVESRPARVRARRRRRRCRRWPATLTADEQADLVAYLLSLKGLAMNTLTRCTLPLFVLLASYQLHAQVSYDRLLRAASEPRNWLTYWRHLHQPALQPARSGHAGERHQPGARSGCSRTRCSAPGSRTRWSSTASCT